MVLCRFVAEVDEKNENKFHIQTHRNGMNRMKTKPATGNKFKIDNNKKCKTQLPGIWNFICFSLRLLLPSTATTATTKTSSSLMFVSTLNLETCINVDEAQQQPFHFSFCRGNKKKQKIIENMNVFGVHFATGSIVTEHCQLDFVQRKRRKKRY